jgi:hypothetical protein
LRRLHQLEDVLEELGAEVVQDLEDVYSDDHILLDIRSKVAAIPYKRFLKAEARTPWGEHTMTTFTGTSLKDWIEHFRYGVSRACVCRGLESTQLSDSGLLSS